MLTTFAMTIGHFAKYEGLGNDFVVVDHDVSPEEAARVCDRRFGIGADGVLAVLPAKDSRHAARMRVVNADGSVPEMCGNGLRCVAVHVAQARGVARGELSFETDAGVRACAIDGEMVTVDMGVVAVLGERALDLDGEPFAVTLADAGNPHAVAFVDDPRSTAERIGRRIATHASFARGTNAELARVVSDTEIDLVVWERGVGITMACGTGACATAAVAVSKNRARRGVPVTVNLPGGALEITIDDAGRAFMRGPARRVFVGDLVGRPDAKIA